VKFGLKSGFENGGKMRKNVRFEYWLEEKRKKQYARNLDVLRSFYHRIALIERIGI